MIQLKRIFKVLIIYNLILLHIYSALAQIETRIIGGKATNITRMPYLVRLFENNIFFCAGTIISPFYVVTAGHCVFQRRAENITIVAGSTYLYEEGVRTTVHSFMLPNSFNFFYYRRDIAVLKLKNALVGAAIEPVALCSKTWSSNTNVQIYGWGLMHERDIYLPTQMRTAEVKTIDNDECSKLYPIPITKTMFCASLPGRKDTCFGDSGGPAIINEEFCGVISSAVGCGDAKYPGIYTNVLKMVQFIKRAIRKLGKSF